MNIIIILITLLAGTIITYASGNKFAPKVALGFSLIAAVLAVIFTWQYHTTRFEYSIQWLAKPNMTFSLKADGLSLLMLLLNTLLLPLIILTSIKHRVRSEKVLYSLLLFMSFAMAGAFLSSDALLYYVFWEASLLPIYFIVVLWGDGDKQERIKATMTFFVYTFAGSLFMLAAIVYMYYKTGSFQLHDFYNAQLNHTEQIGVFVGFFLAYAIKIPIFPFHTWQANVYQKAPLVGTLMLGAIMSKMGLYSVIRWQLPITPYALEYFQNTILILTIIGVVYGSIIALRQDNLKRLFAYASLAHVGIIASGIYSLTFDGLFGAVILILAHGVTTIGLFFSSDIIHKRANTFQISELGGIKNQSPQFTIAFLLIILASITLPLSFNFVGEFAILYGLSQVNLWFVLIAGSSMFLGAFYMLRMYQYTILGETKTFPFWDLTSNEKCILIVLISILIFFGVYSQPILDMVSPSLNEILVYINR